MFSVIAHTMANRLKGEQELKLGGRTWIIKYDLNASMRLDSHTGWDPLTTIRSKKRLTML